MVRSSRKLMVIGVLVVAALLVTASQSEACWGWGCYQPVSYYTPYYASWCAPCYVSCCYTPCYTPYCGGCWGGCYTGCYSCGYWGCCGWDSCYCDPCCTTTVSSCCGSVSVDATVAPAEQQPTLAPSESETPGTQQVMPAMPSGAENAVPGDTSTYLPTRHTSGLLTIWVPANAKVFINGKETTTEGSRRRYVSYGLQKGLTYKYEIRAEVVRNGMLAEEEKTVYLTAGANEGVAFGFNRQPSNQVAAQQ